MANKVTEPEELLLPGSTDDDFDGPFLEAVPAPRVFESPDMDPGHRMWNPRKYFAAQPKVTIVIERNDSDILADPHNKNETKIPVSINGYTLNIVKGKPVRVPRDFALHIIDIKAGFAYDSIPDAEEG